MLCWNLPINWITLCIRIWVISTKRFAEICCHSEIRWHGVGLCGDREREPNFSDFSMKWRYYSNLAMLNIIFKMAAWIKTMKTWTKVEYDRKIISYQHVACAITYVTEGNKIYFFLASILIVFISCLYNYS
jgi:hypothetical protein